MLSESWKCVVVGLAFAWVNAGTGLSQREIVAEHYRVGTEARTCESGTGACFVYVVEKSNPDGPLCGALAWRRPGVELASFDATSAAFGEGSTVAVYP